MFGGAQQMGQSCIDLFADPPGVVTLKIVYSKEPTQPPEESSHYQSPELVPDDAGGSLIYAYRDQFDAAFISIPPDSLASPALVHVNMVGELPAPAPEGVVLRGAMFDFAIIDGGPLVGTAMIGFGFFGGAEGLFMRWFDPEAGVWTEPPGPATFDPAGHVVVTDTGVLGTYAVFGPPLPQPGVPAADWRGVLMVSLLVLACGVVAVRSRIKPVAR